MWYLAYSTCFFDRRRPTSASLHDLISIAPRGLCIEASHFICLSIFGFVHIYFLGLVFRSFPQILGMFQDIRQRLLLGHRSIRYFADTLHFAFVSRRCGAVKLPRTAFAVCSAVRIFSVVFHSLVYDILCLTMYPVLSPPSWHCCRGLPDCMTTQSVLTPCCEVVDGSLLIRSGESAAEWSRCLP